MKVKIRYKGNMVLGNPYKAQGYSIPVGGTAIVDEEEAIRLLKRFPAYFELVEPPMEKPVEDSTTAAKEDPSPKEADDVKPDPPKFKGRAGRPKKG